MTGPGALFTSALLHAGLIALGAWLLHQSLASSAKSAHDVARTIDVSVEEPGISLPKLSARGLAGATDEAAEPRPEQAGGTLGGERTARPDIPEPGLGGSTEASEAALNLSDSVDGLSLDRDPLSRLDRSQLQRLRTGDERRSWDDRRATPNPMELTFLASGDRGLMLRRPPAERDPSRGSAHGGRLASAGGRTGGPETEADTGGREPEAGAAEPGAARAVRSLGVPSGGEGRDHRRSARVTLARPMVTPGRAAVPAPTRGRPNDTVDSTQDVAKTVASLIHASTAGGRRGSGVGGERGPGVPASGGLAGSSGSRSAAAGSGPGALQDIGLDAGVLGYFRAVERKVDWNDAFPSWAIAEGRGGLAVVTLVIRQDGTLLSATLTRASGVPEFDQNLLAAVRRASPFAPLPPALRPGPQPLRMTFDATNPAVGRDGPGKGRRRGP